MKPNSRKQAGFTLLEVLIAMVVIALAISAIIGTASSAANNTGHLRDKTFAHWVAMNKMAELQLAQSFPEIGEKTTDAEMAGLTWKVATKVSGTPDKNIRRIDIRVRMEKDKKDTSITLLTGFLGNN